MSFTRGKTTVVLNRKERAVGFKALGLRGSSAQTR